MKSKFNYTWSPFIIWNISFRNIGLIFFYTILWTCLTFNIATLCQNFCALFDIYFLNLMFALSTLIVLFLFSDHLHLTDSSKLNRAEQLLNKIPYWDIWETQADHLQGQYYTYYTYIWEHWHEMEERLLWIACTRAALIGA